MNNGLEFKPTNTNKLHFKKETFDEISEILHIIRKHKGQTNGEKCGLHIHIDATKLTDEELIKIANEIVVKQNYIIKEFNVSSTRLEKYCLPITKKDIKGLNTTILKMFRKKDYKENYPELLSSKYFLLNFSSLQEYGTIEFRLFNGTKSLKEIKKILIYIFEFLINSLERD
jgi:hypothetical protein